MSEVDGSVEVSALLIFLSELYKCSLWINSSCINIYEYIFQRLYTEAILFLTNMKNTK